MQRGTRPLGLPPRAVYALPSAELRSVPSGRTDRPMNSPPSTTAASDFWKLELDHLLFALVEKRGRVMRAFEHAVVLVSGLLGHKISAR